MLFKIHLLSTANIHNTFHEHLRGRLKRDIIYLYPDQITFVCLHTLR